MRVFLTSKPNEHVLALPYMSGSCAKLTMRVLNALWAISTLMLVSMCVTLLFDCKIHR